MITAASSDLIHRRSRRCSPFAVAVGGTVAAVSVGSVAVSVVLVRDGDGGDGGLVGGTVLAVGGSSLLVGVGGAGVVTIVVLGPLVVISPDLARVLLVVVGFGSDGVVGLAPSGVVVGAVGLLGPLVVVVIIIYRS